MATMVTIMAVIKTITQTKLAIGAAALLLAMGAWGLSTFFTVTAYKVVEQNVAVAQYRLSDADKAIVLAADNRDEHDHAASILRKAGKREPQLKNRLLLLQSAREHQESALRLTPADTFGWARLADLRLITQNNREGAMDALQMSARVAPYVPNMMLSRAMQMHQLRDAANTDDALMAATWRSAFRADAKGLAQRAQKRQELISTITTALSDDVRVLARWEQQLKAASVKR
jgi:hypothetical protein